MPDPAWPALPPETNYLRLVGPGAAGVATTVASAAAWQALMVSNELAFSLSMLNTAVTALNFEGLGGASSLAAITELNTSLQLLAVWVQEKPPVAASAVAAYQTAVSAMIPAEISIANRTAQAANVAMNPAVFGALTPTIVALDAEYFGEHWPHNAGVGASYGAALAALTAALAIPPPVAPPSASVAAPATAAAAVTQATGRAVAGEAMTESVQLARSAANLAAPGSAGAFGPTGALGSSGALMGPIQAAIGALQPALGMFATPVQAVRDLGAVQDLGGFAQSVAGPTSTPSAAIGTGAGAIPAAVGPAAVGSGGGSATGAGLGSGVTSYARPARSFAPEYGGRPAGRDFAAPNVTEWRGPTATSGAVPVGPGGAGLLARGREAADDGGGSRARIVADPSSESQRQP